jgi:hypothetical protein
MPHQQVGVNVPLQLVGQFGVPFTLSFVMFAARFPLGVGDYLGFGRALKSAFAGLAANARQPGRDRVG